MKRRTADPTLAVAYIRVSTVDQQNGPRAQLHAIREWCEKHGITLACEPFIDQGVSGGLEFEKRPGLVDALDGLDMYRAAILVAHKRDRFARDREVMGNLLLMLRKKGQRICTTDRPPGDPEELDPMLKAMEGMGDVFAELERSLIRARTKAALQAKRRNGERVGTIPYGFKLDTDGIHICKDAREQKLVKLVRKLRREGGSLRGIAAELERQDYKPRNGKSWHPTVIKQIAEYDLPKGQR
jgi:DNA invertase Pin-like site-specific DNA recombinase